MEDDRHIDLASGRDQRRGTVPLSAVRYKTRAAADEKADDLRLEMEISFQAVRGSMYLLVLLMRTHYEIYVFFVSILLCNICSQINVFNPFVRLNQLPCTRHITSPAF